VPLPYWRSWRTQPIYAISIRDPFVCFRSSDRVTGESLDPRGPIQVTVDGTCCDTNRIRSMISLLDDEVRTTAIKHWPRGQRKKLASSLYLEVFNANGETNEMLFTIAGLDLLHLGPTSYIDAKTNLHEAILSLLEIATHEVSEPKAKWAIKKDQPN